jgi:nucleoside-diphosphate-sugar epimerase
LIDGDGRAIDLATYLVTGGAGFIGSNLVETLVEQGHTVRVLDNFSTGKRKNLAAVGNQIDLIEGDLVNLDDVRRAVAGVEVVFHQAAIPSVPRSVEDPIASDEANVLGTLHVLVAARDAGVRRVVYASSSSVYGDQAPEAPKTETMAPKPISPYGVAKLAAEHYCRVFYRVYGLDTVSLRYFNVFGPRQDPNSAYAAVIPRFITAILAGRRPTVYGDGEQTRDFTYVGNVVAGNLLAANAPSRKVAGEVFNLAAGGQISLNDLLGTLRGIAGSDIAAAYTDPRAGDIRHSHADTSKAQAGFGFSLDISFEEGLRRTVAWYREVAAHA